MKSKVVLITGSSSGIGEATALRFASLGCRIVIHGRDRTRAEEVAENCRRISPQEYKPIVVLGDIKDGNIVAKLIEKTIASFDRLDVLVNNAGSFKPIKFDDVNSYRAYSDLMQINLHSVVLLSSLATPHLKQSKGCIVNISSNLHSKCFEGGFAYCTAKAALNMFTKSIAVDLAPDVRVNSVSPGPVATMMSARLGVDVDTYRAQVGQACLINRVGEADEIARVVVFLASQESAYITGTDIIVDGGSTIKP